ncbi:hypothetical protein TIFTF001_010120 [Ficus carica]|uniref:C2H2-type domain-containing protein n=1 Tax=Ficus carica TaxID=3494 RepID=A0AA88A851_FICCA|nr:hypothetical protein TIFTF001_010120 [Ficus carica]
MKCHLRYQNNALTSYSSRLTSSQSPGSGIRCSMCPKNPVLANRSALEEHRKTVHRGSQKSGSVSKSRTIETSLPIAASPLRYLVHFVLRRGISFLG